MSPVISCYLDHLPGSCLLLILRRWAMTTRVLLWVAFGTALLSPASAKIGWSLEQCVAEYGVVVEKHGDNEVSFPEYVFLKDGIDVTVIMIDERVARITISPQKAFTDPQVLQTLRHYSGKPTWEQRPATEKETTEKISEFTANEKTHKYYCTPDKSLYGFVKTNWVGNRPFFVMITIPNHTERLQRYRHQRRKEAP
jgi:hypothetical protein